MADYNCDRKAKNDFTASTVQYLRTIGYMKPPKFMEEDDNRNLVEYGSSAASMTAGVDIYMFYGGSKYVIELKERYKYDHDDYWIMNDGTFYNIEKDNKLKERQEDGYIPLFADIYRDNIIRVWNMSGIDLKNLPRTKKMIKRKEIEDTERIMQERALLAVSAATAEFKRYEDKS